MSTEEADKSVLPHHEQQPLCTTRLPYRQGRKLTAVKVYTVNDESNHLLIFGVPSLNLRQETKAMFSKFGKLLQFNITTHATEAFTESYHALYEKIQSARVAKRMLDTKNFYGGSLHVCYAPELETVEETREKLQQRQRDVFYRLHNLKNDMEKKTNTLETASVSNVIENVVDCGQKLNMGEINIICVGRQIRDVVLNKNKRKTKEKPSIVIEKKFKPCFITENVGEKSKNVRLEPIDIVDCTSVEKETIENINEALNYNKFGNEDIRKVPKKEINRIKFNVGHKLL